MRYNKKIFKNYFTGDENSDYLKVHRGNQESYKDNFQPLLPQNKNAKILDIGCGAGQFLFFLKSLGYNNIEGIDIGAKQIEFIKKMGIKGTIIENIPDFLKDKINYYDFIIMNQVIEHFPKDEIFNNLEAIHNSLKKEGQFVLSTPNMACLAGLFQRYVDYTHEIGFTERSIYQVLTIAGFREIEIKGDKIKFKLRPKRILWWLLNKLWYKILNFIYFVEKGVDRPHILSRDLIVIAKK